MIKDDRFPIDPDEIVSIVNPTSEDFTLDVVDIHDKNTMISYTVKALERLKLPRYAADHVSERLAQLIESDYQKTLTQAHHKEVLDTIRMYSYEQ